MCAAWDPVGQATAAAADDAALRNVSNGVVAFVAALGRSVAPELILKEDEFEWVGAMGSGPAGGKKRDLFRLKGAATSSEIEAAKAQTTVPKKEKVVFERKDFSWKRIVHPLQSKVDETADRGFLTELCFNTTVMKLYTDHRVMGRIVLPGVSHVSLMAMTGLLGYSARDKTMGRAEDEAAVVKDVLFQRPYLIPSRPGEGFTPDMDTEDDKMANVVTVYCVAAGVSREFIPFKPL